MGMAMNNTKKFLRSNFDIENKIKKNWSFTNLPDMYIEKPLNGLGNNE